MKRFLTLMLAILLVVTFLPMNVFARDANLEGGSEGHYTGGAQSGSGAGVQVGKGTTVYPGPATAVIRLWELGDIGGQDFKAKIAEKWNIGRLLSTKYTSTPKWTPPIVVGGGNTNAVVAWEAGLKAEFLADPETFMVSLCNEIGYDVDTLKKKIADGVYPTLSIESAFKTNATGGQAKTAMDWTCMLAGSNAPKEMPGTIGAILNKLTLSNPAIGNPQHNWAGPVMIGYGFYNNSWVTLKNDFIGNWQLFEEAGRREGAIYFSLADINLPYIPPPPDTPPPPPIYSEGPLEWRSIPQAFGEVKQGSYSVSRSTENWEAMAGVPHDQKMYYDAGASGLSAHFTVVGATTYTRTWTGAEPTTSHGTNCKNGVCVDCGTHKSKDSPGGDGGTEVPDVSPNISAKPRDLGSMLTNLPVDQNTDSTFTTLSSGDSHYSCSGEHTHSGPTITDNLPTITGYFPLGSYDVLEPTKVSEPLEYLNLGVGNNNLDISLPNGATVVAAIGRKYWTTDFWDKADGSFSCSSCALVHTAVETDIKAQKGEVIAGFEVDKLVVTDRDGREYTVMYDADINFKLLSYTTGGSCGGTLDLKFEMQVPKTGKNKTLPEKSPTYHYSTGLGGTLPLTKMNFLPKEEDWNVYTHLRSSGYNGQYNTPTRRDAITEGGSVATESLFYKDGLSFRARIPNGEKKSGVGRVSYTTVLDGKLGSASAYSSAITEYYRGAGKVNNVLVHTPVAVDSYYITVPFIPYDQRVTNRGGPNDVWLTPSLNFYVNITHEWQHGVDTYQQGIRDTTEQKGVGYPIGLDTIGWIEEKYYRFEHEVLYEGRRYNAGDWIEIPATEIKSLFTLPVSEREVVQAEYEVVVIASNSPYVGNPDGAYAEQAERINNATRAGNPGGSKLAAVHGTTEYNAIDILGRIGNFTIDYTNDPNWGPFFSKKKATWLVPNVIPDVDATLANKYLGPHRDIFDRIWWTPVGGVAKETWNHGLDHWTSVDHYTKGHLGAILPAGPGKNLESVEGLLQFEPIKMGYPVWWSIETIGNYGDSVARMQLHPSFKLFNPVTNETVPVDIYNKVGSSYERIYDYTNRTDVQYRINLTTKLTHDERRIGLKEKQLTQLVMSPAEYAEQFNPANARAIGTLNEIILSKTLRTNVGTNLFEGMNHRPNVTSNSSDAQHAQQAQRWHGTIYVPSSAKFTKPNQKGFIDTEGMYLITFFEFETLDSTPWNITTKDALLVGSNVDGYRPWIAIKDEDETKVDPPTKIETFGPDVVVVFDPNVSSDKDVQIHGTH